MTPQQLEAKVLAAVDALRRGERIEDDYVECKRQWPDPRKARQLAGAANRAAGNDVIWIVGIDESTGAIQHGGTLDPADWWAECSSRFDQAAPELEHHLVVRIGPTESVVALAFRTDRAPYVVKNQSGGSPELEVPIRDGTRTRSARRDELLRLLVPAVSTPPAVVLSAQVSATWRAESHQSDGGVRIPDCTYVDGSADIFIEYVGQGFVMLPKHEMEATLAGRSMTIPLTVDLWGHIRARDSPPPPEPRFSVISRTEGITATGPGTFTVQFHWNRDGDHADLLNSDRWTLHIVLPVAGARRPLRLQAELRRKTIRNFRGGDTFKRLGEWELTRTP